MNLHRHSKLSFRGAVVVIAALVVAVLVISLAPGARNAAHSVALPFWRVGTLGGDFLDSTAALLRTRASLDREIITLRKELTKLQLETLEIPILQEENRRLSELWQQRSYEESVLARVLARPTASPYDTFVLDVGALHAVSQGDLVVTEGIAIGMISHVFSRSSVAKLFSAPGVISIISIGETSVPVEAKGRGAGNFIAEVPRNIDVEKGSTVVLSDISPRVFAIVEQVLAETSDPFRTVYFRLPINFLEVDFVEVVIEGARPLPTEVELTEENESESS